MQPDLYSVNVPSDDPAKKESYDVSIPMTPAEAMERVVREGLMLRQRKIARLEQAGFAPPEIAVELGRQDDGRYGWCLENVLYLMGMGDDEKGKAEMGEQYRRIREEVNHGSLIDVDAQLKENMALALSTLSTLMADPDAKIRLQASKTMLSYNGIGETTIEKKVIEIRMPAKLQDALVALANWKAPDSVLDKLLLDSASNGTEGH